jgi:hypothetical protein
MQFTLSLDIPPLSRPVTYTDSILLTGSCFTEHIADRLQQHKFKIVSNPHGILFNPLSVANSLNGYLENKKYTEADLFYFNELWNSWDHHTRFSNVDQAAAIEAINASQTTAATFIQQAGWVIITLGSSFQYYLKESGKPVSNNHRAPAQWFEKRLLSINEITGALDATLNKLFAANPSVQVLFTISPVRHIRDGVIANNLSKARLIEAVHTLCGTHEKAHYFPAYELLIDVLRDYRFYDVDMVHPNYMGTTYVWEQFVKSCIAPSQIEVMEQVRDIMTACNHRTRFPATEAHKKFKESYAAKTAVLMNKYPFLDLSAELKYFTI